MSIDEDGGIAARDNNHKDYEDNGDDDDIYNNDNGCNLFKVSMATKTIITLRLFHIVVDDGDGDDGNDDGIDKTKNKSNDNNHLSGGGTLPLPPNRPTQSSEHHGSSDHQKDSAWEQNKKILNVNYS